MAGEEDEDVVTSVSGTTAVAAGLPADVGSHVQRRVREIEDEASRFLSDSSNKVPVPARPAGGNAPGDGRGRWQTRSLEAAPGISAAPGHPGLAAVDLAGCAGEAGAPPAAPGGPRSYAAALAGGGPSLAPSEFGLEANWPCLKRAIDLC
ncbi:hypothetical protein MTO96_037084 [Rhipicephalus appendiculatus]